MQIAGVRFTVIGVMDRKMQMSNYFTSDDDSVFIPVLGGGRYLEYEICRGDGLRADSATV